MGGSPGTHAAMVDNKGTTKDLDSLRGYSSAGDNKQVQDIMSGYGSGKSSLQDALGALGGVTSDNPASQGAFSQGAMNQLVSNPITGSKVAQDQVMSNPLYSGLFGAGGQADQAHNNYSQASSNLNDDRNALSGRDPSYGLQDSDLKAYGQASNNIGRASAMQDKGISQALAARGLGSSNNGSAISSFAGNFGNKAEQLAGLQQNIAQNRINTAQGLAQARTNSDLQRQQAASGYSTQLGNLGNSAYNAQRSGNAEAADNDYNRKAGTAASSLNNQIGQQNINNEAFKQVQDTKEKDILGKIGDAATSGISGAVSGLAGGVVKKGLGSLL